MSNVIQCFGFHVIPLGQIPLLPQTENVAPFLLNKLWYSSQVVIEATGETQVFQIYPFVNQLQSHADLRALESGNHRCGNW